MAAARKSQAVAPGIGRAGRVFTAAERDWASYAVRLCVCEAAGLRDGRRRQVLNRAEAKAALGARGDVAWAECSDAVFAAMNGDVMRSVRPQVESMLRRGRRATRVLLYQGVRNHRDDVVSIEAWLARVRWDGLCALWRTDAGELAAYVQRSGSLAHLAVYGAGHLPP